MMSISFHNSCGFDLLSSDMGKSQIIGNTCYKYFLTSITKFFLSNTTVEYYEWEFYGKSLNIKLNILR